MLISYYRMRNAILNFVRQIESMSIEKEAKTYDEVGRCTLEVKMKPTITLKEIRQMIVGVFPANDMSAFNRLVIF